MKSPHSFLALYIPKICFLGLTILGDQLYIAVFSWYLVICDLSSVRYCTIAYTSVTFYKEPKQHGHVYLVTLYIVYGVSEVHRINSLRTHVPRRNKTLISMHYIYIRKWAKYLGLGIVCKTQKFLTATDMANCL